MAVPVEVAFDRALRPHSGLPSARQLGKLDFDPEVDSLLGDVHRLANQVFNSKRAAPRLYFDFVDAADVNAFAFNGSGWAFVGVTLPLVKEIQRLADTLVSFPQTSEIMPGARIGSDALGGLWTVLFNTTLQFVVFHEVGHHICGHVPDADHAAGLLRIEYRETTLTVQPRL